MGSTTATRHCAFGHLTIEFDDRALEPRPWTTMHSQWAAELARELPAGRILELCAGAGQIGLLAAVLSGRDLVQVEADAAVAGFAQRNAAAAGWADNVEIRNVPMEDALRADERFPLVAADPPYLRHDETDRFPEDPLTAIDGGPDGLALVRVCLEVAAAHLVAGGALLLQVAGRAQAAEAAALPECGALSYEGLREVDDRRAVALFRAPVER